MTLVTGGDDQAVHVAVFQLRSSSAGTAADVPSSSLQLTMLCCCHVHSAHTSAIRVRFCLTPQGNLQHKRKLKCHANMRWIVVTFLLSLLRFLSAANALHNSG